MQSIQRGFEMTTPIFSEKDNHSQDFIKGFKKKAPCLDGANTKTNKPVFSTKDIEKEIEGLKKKIEKMEEDYQDWKEEGYPSIEDYVCEHIDTNDEYLELKAKLSAYEDALKIFRGAVHNILERIWNIDLKTTLGRNRLPSIILVEVEEIIKQEVGTLADKEKKEFEKLKEEFKELKGEKSNGNTNRTRNRI